MRKDIYIPNVDMDILYSQAAELQDMIWDKPDSILWGIIEMLDVMIGTYEPDFAIDSVE